MTLEYFLTSLVIVLLPGTGVIYTLAYGIGHGWRASVVAAFGCTLGIVPHIVASIIGLAALLHTSAVVFQVVKFLGVAYLLYMAWSVLREGGALEVTGKKKVVSNLKIIMDGIALNSLNPKLSLFFLAFLPQFIPSDSSEPTYEMLILAAIFMLMTFVVFAGYGAFASITRKYIISRPNVLAWIRRSFAVTFSALGVRLAFAER